MANGLLEGILQGLMAGREQKRQSVLDQLRLQHEKQYLDLQKAQMKAAEQEFKFKLIDRQRKEFESQGKTRENVLNQFGVVPDQTPEELGQVPQEAFEAQKRLLGGAEPLRDMGLQEAVATGQLASEVPVTKKALKVDTSLSEYDFAHQYPEEAAAYQKQKQLDKFSKATLPGSSPRFKAVQKQHEVLGKRLDNLKGKLIAVPMGDAGKTARESLQSQIDKLQPIYNKLDKVVTDTLQLPNTVPTDTSQVANKLKRFFELLNKANQ